MSTSRKFWQVAGAGTAFQAGSSAVDSATIMSALVFQLTGSPVAVGAVSTILRVGWLMPQLFVGYFAGKDTASMPYYVVGAFGRASAIALLAGVLWLGSAAGWSFATLGVATLGLWTLYAFLSGIVGVPYNDIVARSIASDQRSRLLALRFFGGGVVALFIAALANRMLRTLDFPVSYAVILSIAAALMLLSAIIFTWLGEPKRSASTKAANNFAAYLREGVIVFGKDLNFRRFVFAQWSGGAVLMAAPFFVVAADTLGVGFENVALLLGAQTAGALIANPLWGWWGDRLGKLSLMRGIAVARIVPPLFLLALLVLPVPKNTVMPILTALFFALGALANGLTIAVIGLLMEISPDDQRPAYSGYFNGLAAPAFLLPLLGGIAVVMFGINTVFVLSAAAAISQAMFLKRLDLPKPDYS